MKKVILILLFLGITALLFLFSIPEAIQQKTTSLNSAHQKLHNRMKILSKIKKNASMQPRKRDSFKSLDTAMNAIVKKEEDTVLVINMEALLSSSNGAKLIDCFSRIYGKQWVPQIFANAGVSLEDIDYISILDFNRLDTPYPRPGMLMAGDFENSDFSDVRQDTRFMKETVDHNEVYSYRGGGTGLPLLFTNKKSVIYAGSSTQGRELSRKLNRLDDTVKSDNVPPSSEVSGSIAPRSITRLLKFGDTINDALLNTVSKIEGKLELGDGATLSLHFESESPVAMYFLLTSMKIALPLLHPFGDAKIEVDGCTMLISLDQKLFDELLLDKCKGEE